MFPASDVFNLVFTVVLIMAFLNPDVEGLALFFYLGCFASVFAVAVVVLDGGLNGNS